MQEYKRQLKAKGDPQDQMLIELLDVEPDLIEVTNRLRALKYVIAEMIGVQV